jgi:hypothetical protein
MTPAGDEPMLPVFRFLSVKTHHVASRHHHCLESVCLTGVTDSPRVEEEPGADCR